MKVRLFLTLIIASTAAPANVQIPDAYRSIAKTEGVPEHILYAIALQESKWTFSGIVGPWPWTLNVDGKAERYPNRTTMANGIAAAKARGARFIDVGSMQINLHWHGHRFSSESAVVDPYAVIRVGAQILSEEAKACHGDWWCAVGHYHSRRPKRADRYRQGVRKIWQSLGGRS